MLKISPPSFTPGRMRDARNQECEMALTSGRQIWLALESFKKAYGYPIQPDGKVLVGGMNLFDPSQPHCIHFGRRRSVKGRIG